MRSINFAAEPGRDEGGATVVEFLGVMVLAVAALMVLIQASLWVWTRNVVVNAADEGARVAAEAGRPLGVGTARTRSVLHDGLAGGADRFVVMTEQDGDAVVVAVRGEAVRIVPFLPAFEVTARARAYDEDEVLVP
jgi:hypothetical protein